MCAVNVVSSVFDVCVSFCTCLGCLRLGDSDDSDGVGSVGVGVLRVSVFLLWA